MDNVLVGISRDQWTSYVVYRFNEKTMMAESGQKPRRAQLYLATHKKEDGSYVNEAAREICPSDAASGSISPMGVRSSGDSNLSENH
ncbi:uncharacterized protein [Nicotiana tomentosiformis]|uniref:uncharacterized protein isoform X4 n=1 Tax=Nicotiana tomentosiformis TaxID=4098 RepID=UPI00388CC4B6